MCNACSRDGRNGKSLLLLRNPEAQASGGMEPAAADENTRFAPAPAQGVSPPETPKTGRTRRKLWDLKRVLHCPVIGTCLDIDAWRRIARTQGEAVECLNDYEVHVRFVASATQRNAWSIAAQKALDRAHDRFVRRFAHARSRERLAELWDQSLAEGEVPGGFWALLTHPLCDPALTDRAYEEVHMLSHQIGAGKRADLRQLSDARNENASLRRELEERQRRHRQTLDLRDRRIAQLEAELAAALEHRRAAETSARVALQRIDQLGGVSTQERLRAIAERARAAEERTKTLHEELKASREACRLAETSAEAWRREFQEQREQCATLERLLLPTVAACDGCAEGGAANGPDLCGRRILCVGGRSHVIEHYRELVSRCNGQFEHHDGGIEDKPQRLDALLSSADAVICAVDCVSHDAYHRSKRFCKRSAKQCVLLRSSGVSTFARALEKVAANESPDLSGANDSEPLPATMTAAIHAP